MVQNKNRALEVLHPLIKTLLICLLIGLSFGSYLYFSYDPHWQRIATSLISTVLIGCLMMACIYQRRYILWITPNHGLRILIMIAVLCAAALAGTELSLLLQLLLRPSGQYILFGGSNIYVLNILIVLVTGIPIYAAEEARENLNHRIANQQYRLLQLEKQQVEVELELLRAKVNPHFLYNIHNTIAGLIRTDASKAEEMILLLSRFFRFTLNKNSSTLHGIQDELDIVLTYLQLQQIRYEERLKYEIDIAPETLVIQIPSFILQPLVENAIKHGIERSSSTGLVNIQIAVEGKNLILTVGDSGPDFLHTPTTGHGISIILNKLKLLYGENFSLELINKPQKNVRITLPYNNQHGIG